MAEDATGVEDGGWKAFLACCEIVVRKLPSSLGQLIAASYPEGMAPTHFEWLFNQTFEAAIAGSRDNSTWDSLVPHLDVSRTAIKFVPNDESHFPNDPPEVPVEVSSRKVLELFVRCFASAVANSRTLPPDDRALRAEFARCRRAWESDSIEYQLIAPIRGVHVSVFEPVDMGDGLWMSWPDAVGPAALRHLNQFVAFPWAMPVTALLFRRCAIPKSHSLPKARLAPFRQVRHCIRAFRLVTGKMIGCEIAHFVPCEEFFQTGSLCNFVDPMAETVVRDHELTSHAVSATDIGEVRRVAQLLAAPGGNQIAIAIERFSWSFGKHTQEDRIIDLAIALESLLCLAGGDEQLSYRFRLFGAAVLADVPGHEDAKKFLNALYVARSKIVHGAQRLAELEKAKKKPLLGLTTAEFVHRARETTRAIAIRFLQEASDGRSPEKYCQALEGAMIRCAKKNLSDPPEELPCDGD